MNVIVLGYMNSFVNKCRLKLVLYDFQVFQQMINNSKYNGIAIEALSAFCDSVNARIRQFHDSSLKHCKVN